MQLVQKALVFAAKRHAGQQRKYTSEPYLAHLINVARIVATVSTKENMIVAALLHDVLEDTDTTVADVIAEFGDDVAILVLALTDVFTKENWMNFNRAQRKEMERVRLSKVLADAQTIKVADLIDNTSTIEEHDPSFAKVYLEEKRLLLDVLTHANSTLIKKARGIL